MSTRNSDVNLVIRARDEATRALDTIAGSMDRLVNTSDELGSGGREIASTLAALDKSFSAISGSAERAESRIGRIGTTIASKRDEISRLTSEMEDASRAIQILNSPDNVVGAGRDQSQRLGQIKELETRMESLRGRIARISDSIASDQAKIDGSRSALQQLGSTAIAAAEKRAELAAAIELETAALQKNAAAAQAVTALQAQLNRLTGADRPATFDGSTAAQSAEVLAEVAARDELHQRLKAEELARTEAAVATERAAEAQRRFNLAYAPALERGPARNEAEVRAAFSEAESERLGQLKKREMAAEQTAEAERELNAEVARLRSEMNPTAAIQARYAEMLERTNRLHRLGKIDAREHGEAVDWLRAQEKRAIDDSKRGGSSQIGLFGLRPYELTNLSYQLNDIVTSLSSGIPLGQTLAQQGGQILQIFPQAGASIMNAFRNPYILLAASAIGTMVVGIRELRSEADMLRTVLADTSLGGNLGYDPDKIGDAGRAMRDLGISWEEVTNAARLMMSEGVAENYFASMTASAKDLAAATGGDLNESLKQVVDGFTGGYDAIVKLDEATNFLTTAEREHIRAMFDSGEAQAARAEAFRIFQREQSAAAEQAKGPWTDAAKSLGSAWGEFLELLADNKIVIAASNALDWLGERAAIISDRLNNLIAAMQRAQGLEVGLTKQESLAADRAQLVAARDYKREIEAEYRAIGKLTEAQARDRDKRLSRVNSEIYTLGQRIDEVAGDTMSDNPNSQAAKRRSDMLAEIDLQGELEKARDRLDAKEAARIAGLIAYRGEQDAVVAARKRDIAAQKEQESVEQRRKQLGEQEARKREQAAKERERLAQQTSFIAPVDGRVTSGFGPRSSPGGIGSTFHRGVDYAVPTGTGVKAAAGGVVIETGYDAKLGKFVYIDHGNKTISKYGHLSDNTVVQERQVVTQGQLIGKSGNTGASTGPHLHYTVMVNGKPVDPQKGIFAGDGPGRFKIDVGDALQNLEDEIEKEQAAQAKKQGEFNDTLDAEARARERNMGLANLLRGLTGEMLLDAQKQVAVEEAVARDRERALKAGVAYTAEQQRRTEALAAAEFEATRAVQERANARRADVERPISDLSEQRQMLQEQMTFMREAGDFAGANTLEPLLAQVNQQLGDAIDKAREFYEALNPVNNAFGLTAAQIDAILRKLEISKAGLQEWGTIGTLSAREIANAFASTATSAFEKFATALRDGVGVFRALKDTFLDFASNFLRMIAQMIVQQIAFNIAKSIMSSIGIPVGMNHSGGLVGTHSSGTRVVDPSLFASAARYHTGGIVGLRPNEIPAVLERGEEVLTRSDPRHQLNGGGTPGGGGGGVTVVNAIDAADVMSKALDSRPGEKVFLNFIRANKSTIRAAIES